MIEALRADEITITHRVFLKKRTHVLCGAYPPYRGAHYQLQFDVLGICLVREVICCDDECSM